MSSDPVAHPFEAAEVAARELARLSGVARHDVAVVLGSGWGSAALGEVVGEVAVADLPGFPAPTVAGHGALARSVRLAGPGGASGPDGVSAARHALVLTGRVHLYEGHHPRVVVHGVRTAVRAGCSVVVLTNAAGGVRPDLGVGDAVLLTDHLNLTGASPLTGANDERLGPRFPDLGDVYSARLRSAVRAARPDLAEGVYAGFAGPAYETPAEVRMARALGADLVGMSTVLEAVAAAHAGASVVGLSLVTNAAAGLGSAALDHAEVLAVARSASDSLEAVLADVVGAVPGESGGPESEGA